jgi:hypothetical protein
MIETDKYIERIKESAKTIYDYSPELLIPLEALESILNKGLIGMNIDGLPMRTRSKVVNERICEVLGYPVPQSFRRTEPRFPAQNFDKYLQQSNNLQIWNQEISGSRRYVLIKVGENGVIEKVKILTGDQLAPLDKTGKLTSKYQARMVERDSGGLLSKSDTPRITYWYGNLNDAANAMPNENPTKGRMMPIDALYDKLKGMVGESFKDLGATQDRNRAAVFHALVLEKLGYEAYLDDGSYPDIRNQLLEVKLQTSPTIDLGLHSPEDDEVIFQEGEDVFRSSDIRYAIASGATDGDRVTINYVYLVNGKDFSKHFPLFGGKVQNTKLQIPLPNDFWD